MPLLKVSYASVQNEEKKAELIAELTKTTARVLGTQESSVWVILDEVRRENWGVAGASLAEYDRKS